MVLVLLGGERRREFFLGKKRVRGKVDDFFARRHSSASFSSITQSRRSRHSHNHTHTNTMAATADAPPAAPPARATGDEPVPVVSSVGAVYGDGE